jgi:5-formaminoimidazole-4-carboxamide-1-(beta)-D-ribofuranosyl 5'-monophosphate synthetase
MDIASILAKYDQKHLTVGVLGGHSALDVAHGAKQYGFKTVCIARKGREKTYAQYYKSRPMPNLPTRQAGAQRGAPEGVGGRGLGCIDETIVVDTFEDVLQEKIQKKLQKENTIFVHNRYFWVYFPDFKKVEEEFMVPIFGSRHLLKLEERDLLYNQNHLLRDAGIRTPKMYKNAKEIDLGRMVIVKAREAQRKYERGFFLTTAADFDERVSAHIASGMISSDAMNDVTIEEFATHRRVGAAWNRYPQTDKPRWIPADDCGRPDMGEAVYVREDGGDWAHRCYGQGILAGESIRAWRKVCCAVQEVAENH